MSASVEWKMNVYVEGDEPATSAMDAFVAMREALDADERVHGYRLTLHDSNDVVILDATAEPCYSHERPDCPLCSHP